MPRRREGLRRHAAPLSWMRSDAPYDTLIVRVAMDDGHHALCATRFDDDGLVFGSEQAWASVSGRFVALRMREQLIREVFQAVPIRLDLWRRVGDTLFLRDVDVSELGRAQWYVQHSFDVMWDDILRGDSGDEL